MVKIFFFGGGREIKNFSGRFRFLMWEGLEVSSRELKTFQGELRIFSRDSDISSGGCSGFFRVIEAFSWMSFFFLYIGIFWGGIGGRLTNCQ